MIAGGYPAGAGVCGVLSRVGLTLGAIAPEDESKAQRLVFSYLRHWGLVSPGRNPHATYYGVYTKAAARELVGVVGEMRSPIAEREAILTDLYVEPSRRGVEAVGMVLALYKTMVDNGNLQAISALVLPRNESMKRRIKRAFGLDAPTTLVYEYRKQQPLMLRPGINFGSAPARYAS